MATTIDTRVLSVDPLLAEKPSGPVQWTRNVLRFCRRKPLGGIGLVIVVAMLVIAVFVDGALVGSNTPVLAPDGYNHQHIRNTDQGPSIGHPMGTDELGRDIFSRILYGARISAVIGYGSVAIIVVLSLLFGTISGYLTNWVDNLIQRLVDIILSIPALILLVFALSVFAGRAGPYGRMFWIIMIVGFVLSAAGVRVVRASAIAVSNNQFIDAARALGASDWRIMFRHVMPNVVPVAIVLATVNLGAAILAEAAISFLGYGIPQPFPAWGGMLSFAGASQFRAHPIQAVWPGLAIAITVYGFNVLGDALRDVLDPRLRGSR